MEFALDKALKEMTLEEDKPVKLRHVPKTSARERNGCSIMGKLLNPELQKMSSLIHDMPRLWRTYNRCRGFALSNESFQFIFDSEVELQSVLEAGAWTYEDWGLVLERWVEDPPEDYLKTIPIWVRLRNLPLECYDAESIEEIAGYLGKVKEVAFDPMKPQSKGFVRVRLLFDVSKPLRNSKEFELPSGGVVIISFEYERIRKRCFYCQRLTHDKPRCPYYPLNRHLSATVRIPLGTNIRPVQISEDDPLFGVLTNEDVGFDEVTGRPKIAKEVLDEMRTYLMTQDPVEKQIRIERVRRSVWNLEGNVQGKKTLLRLEQPTIVSHDVNKDKGLVFDFEAQREQEVSDGKRIASGLRDGYDLKKGFQDGNKTDRTMSYNDGSFNSTGYKTGHSMASPSGVRNTIVKNRSRPGKWRRQAQNNKKIVMVYKEKQKVVQEGVSTPKRKASEDVGVEEDTTVNVAKRHEIKVVPQEEPLKF